MKKIFMILLILFSSTSHAILCNVNVSDPRYNVVSYIRNQTSCVTTTQANPTLHKNVIGVTLLVMALNQFVENKKSEIADTSKEILLGEYAVVSCNMKNNKDSTYMQKINFLLNDKKAVSIFPDNTSIGNIYENIRDFYKNFSSTMQFKAFTYYIFFIV